jgi:DNA-binding HxlR family transcriptional regulator
MLIHHCPVKLALDVIVGKWKPLILYALKDRTLRFEELKRQVPSCSRKVLVEQLRQLLHCCIIQCTEFPGIQLHTEYRFTTYGETLRSALNARAEWGELHRQTTPAVEAETVTA